MNHATRMKGFSIIEFMIAITLSLLVLAALSTAFVGSSRSREEIERANQQVENGRYAVQVLSDDFQHAGYMAYLDQYCAACYGLNLFGGYSCTSSPCAPVTWSNSPSFPDPCATDPVALRVAMPVHVQGYDNGASPALSCITDVKSGTDIIVLRRASTCAAGSANCALQTGAPYFQASTCNSNTELSSTSTYDPADESTQTRYRLNTDQTKLTLHKKDCTTAADKLRYLVRIYFVANNDQGSDAIPTLKMAELDMGTNASCPSRVTSTSPWCIMPVAEGVENFQVEYGVDYSPNVGDGSPDIYTADPSRFNPSSPGTLQADCAANSKCVTNWQNVMAIRLNVLVRSTTKSKSFTDSKSYQLGVKANGAAYTVCPASQSGCDVTIPTADAAYRRHVYESSIWLINVAGRRAA